MDHARNFGNPPELMDAPPTTLKPWRSASRPSGALHALLWLYFASAFSYAHLPLANLHHSLGSLFNYVGTLLVASGLLLLPHLRFSRAERNTVAGITAILALAFVGEIAQALLSPESKADADLVWRSAETLPSTLLPLITSLLFVKLAGEASFTFRDMARATRFAAAILLCYLAIEVLGATFELEPFASVAEFVSRYLNYRDDLAILGGRVRGFSNEPSYLAVVVMFMFSVILIDRAISNRKRYLLLLAMLVLSSASLSKNLLGGLVILLVVHALYFRKFIIPLAVALLALGGLFYWYLGQNEAILWQYEQYGVDFSTLTRTGSWVAAWNGFLAHPLFGNGLGLAGKLIVSYYPDWFYLSPEAGEWEALAIDFGVPVFSNIFRTLFELGLCGVALVAYLLWSFTRISNRRPFLSHDNALLLIAFLVCYGMVDVLTYWPFYVALALPRFPADVR